APAPSPPPPPSALCAGPIDGAPSCAGLDKFARDPCRQGVTAAGAPPQVLLLPPLPCTQGERAGVRGRGARTAEPSGSAPEAVSRAGRYSIVAYLRVFAPSRFPHAVPLASRRIRSLLP